MAHPDQKKGHLRVAFPVLHCPMVHLILALVVFYSTHSVLAWTGVKRWVSVHWGLDRWYRLTYTLVSLAQLAWVIIAYRGVHGGTGSSPTPVLLVAGWVLLIGGCVLSGSAVLRFGGAGFLGVLPERSTGLVRSGLHGHIRHPIYTGIIVASMGWLLLSWALPTIVVVGITLLYLPIGIHLEERKLIETYGEEYMRYKREVPSIVPRLGRCG